MPLEGKDRWPATNPDYVADGAVTPVPFVEQQLPYNPKFIREPEASQNGEGSLQGGAGGSAVSGPGPFAVAASALIPPTPGGIAGALCLFRHGCCCGECLSSLLRPSQCHPGAAGRRLHRSWYSHHRSRPRHRRWLVRPKLLE